jgi:DNA-binding beta-propeller fold protein YncE
MLFVTFHGGKPGAHPLRNNVHAYDKHGNKVTVAVLEDSPGVVLDELRSISLRGKFLYAVNANNTQNSLLCYEGLGTSYKFVGKFVSQETCKGVVHPFDFAFDGAGHCYVSSQDTNLVSRLIVSADGKIGTPAAVAPALPATLLPGTFVASSVANLCGLHTTAVATPLGLEYSADGIKKHSVRGVAWTNNALYVVDQVAGKVKVYDSGGKLVGQSNPVDSPVHLSVHNGSLYVTGGNQVFTGKLPAHAGNFTLSAIPDLHIKNGGGMAFSDDGTVYIASRTENVILKFDPSFRPVEFKCPLPDNPEFLLHV